MGALRGQGKYIGITRGLCMGAAIQGFHRYVLGHPICLGVVSRDRVQGLDL